MIDYAIVVRCVMVDSGYQFSILAVCGVDGERAGGLPQEGVGLAGGRPAKDA